MCEQTEINYLDGDVVWVKLGPCWWPGQVTGLENLPEDIQTEFKKKPLIAAVKFFQEDTYEFVKNYQQIYKYNCTLKDEFIKKGMDKYRTKSKDGATYMDKFPGDVEIAEKLTGGDPDILHQEKFCPEEKPDISALFGEKKLPKKKRDRQDGHRRSDGMDMTRKITHPRFLRGESDHEVRIRQQPNSLPSTPTSAGSPVYRCHFCNFTSSRVNVIICHIKSHRSDDSPIPQLKMKTYSQPRSRISDTNTPKRKYAKKDKKKTEDKLESPLKRKNLKQTEKPTKRKKTDPELREKLLADWDDESDEEMNINKELDSSLNRRLSNISSENLSSGNDSKDYKEKNAETVENNEFIAETEKLLKETEQLSSIHIMRDSLDSLHASKNMQFNFDKKSEDFENSEKDAKIGDRSNETLNKSQKRDTSSSDSESKHISDKDDKKSRLSCFDFDEDDLSEPSIPPVRKIPRVFGEKNLSLKKEIIKEFEMSQALKNEIKRETEKISSELSKNMDLKADEIMEIIQGKSNQREKEEKIDEKFNDTVQDETKIKQFDYDDDEEKEEKKITQPENDQESDKTEVLEVEKEKDENFLNAMKDFERESKIASEATIQNEKKDKMENKSTDEKLSEKIDLEDPVVESNDNASMKEADDTLSERFTTETEDETVSESAETLPEQSENSDTDLLDRSIDSLSGNSVTQPLVVKRGRGRPRKNVKTTTDTNVNKSPKPKANRGNKRIRVSERIEIERKTSDSDTDRSYTGRRRKPNKKYLESDIYVQDLDDYKVFRTDESQSESETKASEKIVTKSRRGRRPKVDKKSSEFVAQINKQEIEVADQIPTVAENNVSLSIDNKNEASESKKDSEEERKSTEENCDVLKERVKSLDETAIAKVDTAVEDVEMITSFQKSQDNQIEKMEVDINKEVIETEAKDSQKQSKNVEDLRQDEKLLVVEQAENIEAEVQDTLKTNMDILPPKKSQIKKFELSQVFDTNIQVNESIEAESESEFKPESELEVKPEPELKPASKLEFELESKTECKIESESKIEFEFEPQLQSWDEEESKKKDETKTIKSDVTEETDTISITDEQQNALKSSEQENTQHESDVKEQDMESVDEVSQKVQDEQQNIKLKSPGKSPKTNDTKNLPKSPVKTRYKGRFTPETGKGRKDIFLEERPANTFQEAFLKTLQMDKKKIEGTEVSLQGKKEKKTNKRKAEEIEAASTQNKKVDNLNKDFDSSENIQIEENIPIMSDLENVEIVIEEKIETDTKIEDNVLESKDQVEPSSTSKLLLQSETLFENNAKDISTKLDEIPKTSVVTSSLSSDISVPVKKREMPRIIESVTLTEPVQILKAKLSDKTSQKGAKHKLEVDTTKKSEQKSGPKAKIIKIETVTSNSKKAGKSSPHMSLTKKLQVLKTEETDALLEAQKKEQGATSTQTIVTTSVTEKYVQQSAQSLADMELDINSMPFVLSEDVLTPESIEQMPVVISSIIPASTSIPATLSFTPTTQIVSPAQQTQFKVTNETNITETSPTKKKSGVPAILKTKSKAKPTVTNVKSVMPPLTGGVKGLKFQSVQPAGKALLAQKGATPGKYVVVQTAGSQQPRYSVQGKSGTQQKIAISTGGKAAGNAQVIQQGGKVVILTSGQSCQTKMMPLNISKALSGKVQRIVTNKGQVLYPISPQGNIIATKTIIAPKTDATATIAGASSSTTSKLAASGHKIINTQGIITSKGVLTPISGTIAKTALLGTLPQGILTKDGIYTPISASALSGKTIIGSKTLVTKGGATLLASQTPNLGGAKAILTPVSQTITGKTILGTQAVVSNKGTILTPITGQQVKAIAAKSPVKGGKVPYQLQQKVQLPLLQKSPKVPISAAGSQTKVSAKSPSSSTLILQNTANVGTATQKSLPHSKKNTKQTQSSLNIQGVASPSNAQQTMQQAQSKGKAVAAPSVQKVIIPRSRQAKAQQKLVLQKVQEPIVSTVQNIQTKQTAVTTTTAAVVVTPASPVVKTVAQSKQISPVASKPSGKSQASSKAQKNLSNIANSIGTVTTSNVSVAATSVAALSPLEPVDVGKKIKMDVQVETDVAQKETNKAEKLPTERCDVTRVEEPKVVAQPQIMALPTESSDGTQTYVLVTIDEQGQIQPLDNNTLMSLEGTTQNPDGTRTLYIDPSSLGEAGTLDNIVLQFDNSVLPNIQASNVTEANITSQAAMVSESFPASEVIQTSNQDILAAALANTDFQQEINLPDNQAGSVMTQTGLTQTSLINQTILQSTIIPPTEPISSPSVLETSLTLNQPIMTPLEVPSNLPIQSTDSTPTSVVSTIPSSLELPITITNPNISYISTAGETQIQIPGNSMPDIGEIMESPVTVTSGEPTEIPVSTTQYLVIPSLEDNIAAGDMRNVQTAEIAIVPSTSYTVTMPSAIVLENTQVQTTPSMPIIDDTYTDNSQLTATIVPEQTFVDAPVSGMLVSKVSENAGDVAVTSEIIVPSHQISASPQKSITSTSRSLDEERPATLQVYSSQEIPNTSEELIPQQSASEDAASSTMEVARETEVESKEGDASITGLSMNETLIESNSQIGPMEQLSFEVTDSSERCETAGESHETTATDKLKQLAVTEESIDERELTDRQVAAAAGTNKEEARTVSQIFSAESLNPSNDAMELDETVESNLFAKNKREDCQRDEPSSQEDTDRRRLRESMELRFEDEEAIAEASQETPSQSQYERFNVSVSNDSADLPSQSASKLESSSGEATQSIAYEPMETDEEVVAAEREPPSQSFEHTKMSEASQSYETSAESNVNAPTQSFNEIVQSQERPSADEAIDDQSFPTQSYEIDKGESTAENLETDEEISQEGNIPSQSNDVGADGIGTSSVSTNNSGLNEDETASSSYVPETPEKEERDQDQESAISTSSYEIPPCEELNIASSSVTPDTSVSTENTSIHDNGVPEIPTSSSYNLNPDITSTHHVDSVPTSSYEDQVIVEQNVSTSYEVPISMPGLEETCSQNFVTESSDRRRNEPSSYYTHQEVTASYYESVDQDANSRLEEDAHEEHVTPGGYYEGNPQEVSQSYFGPAEETQNYTSHGISPGYYDPSRPESEASQSYYPPDDLDGKTEQSSSPNIEASQSFYRERSSELRLRQQGEATPTYSEGYPVDYTLENSPIERHDLVESSVPATRPMDR